MRVGILWKFFLSGAVIAWAITSMVPFQDTEFEEYVEREVQVDRDQFLELIERARQGVAEEAYPSVYIGLREIAQREEIDLARFFPNIRLLDVRNQQRRNEILLRELLNRSRSALRLGLDLAGGVAFTLRLDPSAVEDLRSWEREEQLRQVVSVMSSRVNALGVAEPTIRPVSDDAVEIQLPGLTLRDDPEGIESLRAPARLEFRTVHRTEMPRSMDDDAPPGYEILLMENEDREGTVFYEPYFVRRIPEATGDIISRARAVPNEAGGFRVTMDFTSEGGDRFADMTRSIVQENQATGTIGRLAIVLDGELYSAPSVQTVIRGSAEITGRFSQREAIELTNVLNNPLAFELEVTDLTEVGPSLAEDARVASIKAAIVGGSLVILFMVFYYGISGVVAVLSISCNVLIVLGVLASFNATLTLPGVAALVLTIGMGVDANILILERIREELREGKKLPHALLDGFNKAFSAIVDANVTTLITASILIWLGTGPVKGFGVTLAVGIVASVFCALVVTRFMLEFLVHRLRVPKILGFLSIPRSQIDFMRYRKPAFIAAWAVVGIGIFSTYASWDRIFGIDFRGGEQVTLTFEERLEIAQIEEVAQARDLGEVMVTYQRVIGGDEREFLVLQTEEERGQAMFEALNQTYREAGLEQVALTRIGAAVSREIQTNAILSVMIALVGILLYVALRFEVGYGIGAVVAVLHDVLMTVGIFVLFGGQFTAPMIAAVLMIVGYSINDTIVTFDRIREELDLHPELTLSKVILIAINRVISRTLLTSFTTLLAAGSLYLFGAGIVRDFAFVFLVGILTGTFSSIFIASPVFYWWHKGDRKHVEERELTPKYDWETGAKA